MVLWFLIGAPVYLAFVLGVARFIHVGMGSDGEAAQ